MSGQVVHFEIPTDDVERAQAFYRNAFAWKINSVPEMNYTLVTTTAVDRNGRPTEPGAINGGMMAREEEINAPVITIEVDDVDQALRRIEELGGKTVRGRQEVGGMGFAAYFSDTEGNVVGLWQNAQPG